MRSELPVGLAGALIMSLAFAPSRAETIQIVIDKLVFSPAEVTAKVGDTIQWINKDSFAHTATVKGGWDVMVPAGKSGRLVIERAESVEYYCRFHPNMKGRVVVAP
jgi:plastocyanin